MTTRLEINKKISKSMKGRKSPLKLDRKMIECLFCKSKIEVIVTSNRKYCSNSCSGKATGRKAGIASSLSRVTRSKNEIYFSELCLKIFKEVETNKNIFNGWDADIIIHDLKIAISWNGPWHYRKITRNHNLNQVMNRDKIKNKEIEKFGYYHYVIKDDGKYNKKFVEKEFKKFIINCVPGRFNSLYLIE